MPVATNDTQQGATFTMSVDGLTLRATKLPPVRRKIGAIKSTYLGTATNDTYIAGELRNYDQYVVEYQNSPSVAQPTLGTTQTFTVTGPTAAGASTPESTAFTGFVVSDDLMPGFSSDSEGLQMKQMIIQFDGTTITRTPSS